MGNRVLCHNDDMVRLGPGETNAATSQADQQIEIGQPFSTGLLLLEKSTRRGRDEQLVLLRPDPQELQIVLMLDGFSVQQEGRSVE